MSDKPRRSVTYGLRYRTDRLYPIRLEAPADDGLVHWAWVNNTTKGPCFFALCDGPCGPQKFRGAERRAFEPPNCLGCYASLDGSENAIWT